MCIWFITEPPKSAGISFDPNELLDFDLEMSGKKGKY